ncbi:hypothetical protein PAXRUDRAFT_174666, partial [Paxillus rubicundulus Ve08.2h10]
KHANPDTVLHIMKSSTAQNLCAAAYKAENGKGCLMTSGKYEAYWNALTAEDKQCWIDKEVLLKNTRWFFIPYILFDSHHLSDQRERKDQQQERRCKGGGIWLRQALALDLLL